MMRRDHKPAEFMRSRLTALALAQLVLFQCSAALAGSFTINDLGTLGACQDCGCSSEAIGISGDLVAGSSDLQCPAYTQRHAFVWTPEGGMVDLGTLGGPQSGVAALVDGQVVGLSDTTDGHDHAFSWTQAGGMVDLGTLGGNNSSAYAVNNGQVVGTAQMPNGDTHAFSWTQSGGMVDLGTLGGTLAIPYAVSNGQIVGGSTTSDGSTHAFSWTDAGGMIDLGTLQGSTRARAVSDGMIVGEMLLNGGDEHGGPYHAFAWTQVDGMVDLGTLGGDSSEAVAVNNGQVIGYSDLPARSFTSAAQHAFSWTQSGGMIDLGTLGGGDYSYARAVEDGQVIGVSYTNSGEIRSFLWTLSDGMLDLGASTGFPYGSVVAVSGSNIVGMVTVDTSGSAAFTTSSARALTTTSSSVAQHAALWTALPLSVRGNSKRPRTDRSGCQVAWVVNKRGRKLDRYGLPRSEQLCIDGDPTCDFKILDPGVCEFQVQICLNNLDPNLPACVPGGIAGLSVLAPHPETITNPSLRATVSGDLAALEDGLLHLLDPVNPGAGYVQSLPLDAGQQHFCSAPFAIDVPLDVGPTRSLKGSITLQTRSIDNGLPRPRSAVSKLKLTCNPPPH